MGRHQPAIGDRLREPLQVGGASVAARVQVQGSRARSLGSMSGRSWVAFIEVTEAVRKGVGVIWGEAEPAALQVTEHGIANLSRSQGAGRAFS